MNLTITSTPFSSRNINANLTKYRYGEQSLKRRGTGFNENSRNIKMKKATSGHSPSPSNDPSENLGDFMLKTRFLKSHANAPRSKDAPESRGNHYYYGRQGVLSAQKEKQIQARTGKTSAIISAQDYEKINDNSTVFDTSTRKPDYQATPVVSFKDTTQVASEKKMTENQFGMVVEDERNKTMIDQNLSGINFSP